MEWTKRDEIALAVLLQIVAKIPYSLKGGDTTKLAAVKGAYRYADFMLEIRESDSSYISIVDRAPV